MSENFKKMSIKELRDRTQSNAPEAGRDPIIGHSIRFFSIYFTKFFLYTRVTPLQVTIISVLMFLIGIGVFAFNDTLLNLLGILIIYISIVLDGTNGELARLQNYRPEIGSTYIEPISHDIQYGLMFIPLAIGAQIQTGSNLVIYAAFVATVSKLIQRFMIARFFVLKQREIKNFESNVDTEGELKIPFNPDVNLPHKIYRWVNRNLFSSVGLVIPLLFCVIIERVDIFVYIFAFVYSVFALMQFCNQIIHVIKIDKPIK